jgi:uncharacterized protein
MELVGREAEKLIIEQMIMSNRSEFLAIYGRRRIGKTYLIDHVCGSKMVFSMAGLHHANLSEQLQNFTLEFQAKTKMFVSKPTNWLDAFSLLKQYIEKLPKGKKVVFIDELPWLSSPKSNFLSSLELFWNSWASKRQDILLVVCGSAASWMIKNIVKNKGGLHNRITQTIRLLPFKLKETEIFLKKNGIQLTKYQITQLYMIMGGVPYYLMAIKKGMSIEQIINALCFSKDGLLRNEFDYIYHSLFDDAEAHLSVIKVLATKSGGLTRAEILKETKLPNAGSTSRVLEELEESGFIAKNVPILNKNKDSLYRVVDFYTLFYLQFVAKQKLNSNTFLSITRLANWPIWLGLAFESICLQHIGEIKNKLGIGGVNTQQASWVKKGSSIEQGTQIDLLIDRDDAIISVCEMKFSKDAFVIKKEYADALRTKLAVFKDVSKTRKSVFLTFVSTFGVQKNDYAFELVQNEVLLDDLFI